MSFYIPEWIVTMLSLIGHIGILFLAAIGAFFVWLFWNFEGIYPTRRK